METTTKIAAVLSTEFTNSIITSAACWSTT